MDESRRLSLNLFLKTMQESGNNDKRYCFILGAGASRAAGIPTGEELAKRWHEEILKRYTPEDLKSTQKLLGVKSIKPSSKNYFDLYALRFYPDYGNGSAFLEKAMEQAQPSIGYHPLASHLSQSKNNLVVTTNFDSLVEDALFIYTNTKPLVVSHELLAGYINFNTRRPIVAKLHRGLFFDPFNRTEQVAGLSDNWKEVLRAAFKIFTPVVVGYAGGDHSLMDFLREEAQLDGLYWCCRHEEPPEEIQTLVEKHDGYFVPIEGFDEMMYLLGETFGYGNPCERIQAVANQRVEDYTQQVEEFKKSLGAVADPTENQSQILSSLEQKYAEDLTRYSAEIEKNPEDAKAYCNRGKTYSSMGKSEAALADLDRAVALDPAYADAYFHRAYVHTKNRRLEEAIEDYSAVLTRRENATAYNNRGACYNLKVQYKEALPDLIRAVELRPDKALYHTNLGKAYSGLKKYPEAEDCFDRALELDKNSLEALLCRGCARDEQEKRDEAVADYEQALKLNPNLARTHNTLGTIYEKMDDDGRALSCFNKAVKLAPDEPMYRANRGDLYRRMGRFQDAIADCNRAIRLDPDCADAYRTRAAAYESLGKGERAAADLARAEELESPVPPPSGI